MVYSPSFLTQDLTLDSQAVGRKLNVRVILPPDYGTAMDRVYPVLYFLHPWGMTPRYLTDKLGLARHVWNETVAGTLPSMAVVVPMGGKSFFMNAADPPGHDWQAVVQRSPDFYRDALHSYGRYGDYLLQEVIPTIQAAYRVRRDRDGRAIGGISMGGVAAALHGFSDVSQFGAVGLHSPALFPGSPGKMGPPWIFGVERESFAERNPDDLALKLDPATAPRILLDCGEQDDLVDEVEQLHQVLERQGIVHEYAILAGGHDKAFWETRIKEWLAFYAQDWAIT
ncbi:MAG TPA: alpha/beta hydrolase-fold protein [Aggregatilineaceae bacterium]|nr:alpha/beta hydrolase-fold protein [Aggregatilineaceae bacterium]